MIGCEPRETFVEPVASGGAGGLHVPVAVADASQAQLLLDLVRLHSCKGIQVQYLTRLWIVWSYELTIGQILFVGKDEYDCVPHLPVVDDPVQLLPGLVYPVPVRAVHHEDQALRARVVMSPKGADFVLATNVLHIVTFIIVQKGTLKISFIDKPQNELRCIRSDNVNNSPTTVKLYRVLSQTERS